MQKYLTWVLSKRYRNAIMRKHFKTTQKSFILFFHGARISCNLSKFVLVRSAEGFLNVIKVLLSSSVAFFKNFFYVLEERNPAGETHHPSVLKTIRTPYDCVFLQLLDIYCKYLTLVGNSVLKYSFENLSFS